jgi:hypothetical protein
MPTIFMIANDGGLIGKQFVFYSQDFKPAVQFSCLLSLSIGRDFIWQMATKNLSVGGFIY